jgi:ABC-type glycerol-3-phosphate transport system permease component
MAGATRVRLAAAITKSMCRPRKIRISTASRADGTAMGAMMAAAVLYTLPMVTIFFAAQKTFVRGIVTTGFK